MLRRRRSSRTRMVVVVLLGQRDARSHHQNQNRETLLHGVPRCPDQTHGSLPIAKIDG